MAVSYLAGYPALELRSILGSHIAWETYATARLISDKDLALLRAYDKREASVRESLLAKDGPAHLASFIAVLKGVTKADTCQYVLASLIELLQEKPDRARGFHASAEGTPDACSVLLRLLARDDWPTQEMAARVLCAVLDFRPKKSSAFANGILAADANASMAAAYGPADTTEPHISAFVDWLVAQLRRPSNPARSVPVATSCLSSLLKERGSRTLFFRASGVQLLPPLLKASNVPANTQLLYELSLCAWQMTFVSEAAEMMGRSGIVKALVEVARTAQKEKLQNWGDEDIVELLVFLDEKLKAGIRALSSFELYKTEVLRGALDWSPMHTSDVFWKENVEKFEDKDYAILRTLLKLVESSREPRTVAVGCSDIGHFVSVHPQGRYIVNSLRGKEIAMRQMISSDAEVQKHALLCVQKLMLTKEKMEFISGTA
ncbi:hypothetical protein FOA52_008139 [Chlamydomonas sp. UWO 241]|nr:hypothetical protein FOA52_008139 [Chlamydomonas sp. UWO 241]